MFEEFSSGYYLGRLYVQPRDETDDPAPAAINPEHHERVNEELFASGEGLERLDHPLVMKLGRTHFPVLGDPGVPSGTLAVPERLLDRESCDAPSLCEVFLAKADRADQMLRASGWGPNRAAVA